MPRRLSVVLALLPGCTYLGSGSLDRDGDGVLDVVDCDFSSVDAANRSQWVEAWRDQDGDGFGAGDSERFCHEPDAGWVLNEADCDDDDAEVHPGAVERCDTVGVDDDCNGRIDDQDDAPLGAQIMLPDIDGDRYAAAGDLSSAPRRCELLPLHVFYEGGAFDCDDSRADVNPGAAEVLCDGVDNDCDGETDEVGDGDVVGYLYRDDDGDGYPDDLERIVDCGVPEGYVVEQAVPQPVHEHVDCDPTNPSIHPGAPEVCNGIDDDCDGEVDEGLVFVTYYVDDDGDGFGAPDGPRVSTCDGPPPGAVADDSDCDDANGDVHPDAPEVCNDADDDCDGVVDDGLALFDTWMDADGDTWGAGAPESSCRVIPGRVLRAGDCDDIDPAIHPDAEERCDGIDGDCDGMEAALVTVWRDDGVWYNQDYGEIDASDAVEVAICSSPGPAPGLRIDAGDLTDRSLWIHGIDADDDAAVSSVDGSRPVITATLGVRGELTVSDLTLVGPGAGIVAEGEDGVLGMDRVALAGVSGEPNLDFSLFEGEIRMSDVRSSGGSGSFLEAKGRLEGDRVEVLDHAGSLLDVVDGAMRELRVTGGVGAPLEALIRVRGPGQFMFEDSSLAQVAASGPLALVDSGAGLTWIRGHVTDAETSSAFQIGGGLSTIDLRLERVVAGEAPMVVRNGAIAVLTRTRFQSNRGSQAGAIASDGTLVTQNGTFTGNLSTGAGGAVHVRAGQWLGVSTSLGSNRATHGGALAVQSGTVTLSGFTSLSTNSATGDGGSFWVGHGGTLLVRDAMVAYQGNASAENGGVLWSAGQVRFDFLGESREAAPTVHVAAGVTSILGWTSSAVFEGYGVVATVDGGRLEVSNFCPAGYAAAFISRQGSAGPGDTGYGYGGYGYGGYGYGGEPDPGAESSYLVPVIGECPTVPGYGVDMGFGIYGELLCTAQSCDCVAGCP